MWFLRLLLVLGIGFACGAQAGVDPADLAFWTSLRSDNPAELQAYLEAFPNGRFAELARIRLKAARAAFAVPLPSAAASQPSPPATAAVVQASVVPAKQSLRSVEPVIVDLDARGLANGSNLRLAVVPAGTPDAIADGGLFDRSSALVGATRARVTLPPGPSGRNEVRLYYIPPFATAFVVAARAPVDVTAGRPGAVPAHRLIAEAAVTNPVQFTAKYRDRSLTVEGQFLRVQPRTVDEVSMAALLKGGSGVVQHAYVIISVGVQGIATRPNEPSEILCAMSAERPGGIDRIAALALGDALVVRGVPTTWSAAFGAVAVIMNPCEMAD